MCGKMGVGVLLAMVWLVMPGCASTSDARYVYQDGEFGVVAIPKNTTEGPNHYREQAEALMAHHFPQGYEIVRAEEVVEGSRTLTLGKTGNTELAPQVTPHVLALLKIGASMTRSQADTLALRECRIIYKKADPHSAPITGGFAPEPALTPTCYRDPNTEPPRSPEKTVAKAAPPKSDQESARPSERLVGE
jgi:hypothetical protein